MPYGAIQDRFARDALITESNLQTFLANLSPPQAVVVGALIAAVAAFTSNVLSGILRDFVSKSWSEGRGRRKSGEEIFQKYAEPLATGATSLFWRLNETLAGDGRGLFLVSVEPRTDFEKYKLLSTYYRLAAVLGCIRALRREFSSHFESSLADGHHVEIQRLRGVLRIYGVSKSIDQKLELRVTTKLCANDKVVPCSITGTRSNRVTDRSSRSPLHTNRGHDRNRA